MKKGSKSSKRVKKAPFAKRPSSGAMGLIVALTVFNLVYSYAVGLPLPRAVVSSYVESVYELGDKQVEAYNVMGAAVVAVASLPARFSVASPSVANEALSPAPPKPLLLIAPNQISIAK